MDPTASLYEVSVWIRENPWQLIALAGLGPLLLGILVERLSRSDPPLEGAAPVEPEGGEAPPEPSSSEFVAAEEPEKVVELYNNDPQLMSGLQNRVIEDQVAEWVAEHAKTTVQDLSFDEVMRPAGA